LRELARGFWNYHRDIAGARRLRGSEVDASLRSWRFSRDRRLFVIRSADRVAGFIVLRKDPDAPIFWGEELYVHPRFRGRGLAREAMRFAERYVVSKGGNALYLWIASSNARTLNVLQHLGYRALNMVELRKDLIPRRRSGKRPLGGRSSSATLWGIPFEVRRPASTKS
jgi:GNAT superfamily N-acetyltransferase